MKQLFSILILLVPFLRAEATELALIPKPLEVALGKETFLFTAETGIVYDASHPDLRRIAGFLTNHLQQQHGIMLQQGPGRAGTVWLKVNPLYGGGEEAYRLKSDASGVILESSSPCGLFYGLQTLKQMLPASPDLSPVIPGVEITDRPRFGWRGLHLDVGRHFFPVSYLKKYIDFMARYKLNRFHWHLTEDQGWRIEIKAHPLLTGLSHWRDETIVASTYRHKGIQGVQPQYDGTGYGGFYTQDQIREIVRYAAERYITVVPEIEMPGHSGAALAAYPSLGCTGGPYRVQTSWGIYEDVFCAGKEETFLFLEEVLSEVCELFPSPWIHIGGDECPKTRWRECPRCQARIREEKLSDVAELQSYFIRRIGNFLQSKGKRIIGWEEIQEGGLAESATVMAWKNTGSLGMVAARQGHDVVVCPTASCYLNIYQTRGKGANPGDYRTDGAEPVAFRGYISLEKVYGFEPVFPELETEAAKHIIGAQANLWTEFIANTSVLEYMLFPRLCALAEVVWTARENKDYREFRKRLETEVRRLERDGTNYCKNPDG